MAILIFVNFRKSVEKCGNEKRKLKKRRCQRLALGDGLSKVKVFGTLRLSLFST